MNQRVVTPSLARKMQKRRAAGESVKSISLDMGFHRTVVSKYTMEPQAVKTRGRPARHGHWCNGRRSATYTSWESMRKRCYNPEDPKYPIYGGAGVVVEWPTFEDFLRDMGERPAGTTIGRIDGAKNYCRGNCEWQTATEQNRNRRGVWMTLQLAEQLRTRYSAGGITQKALAQELDVNTGYMNRLLRRQIWA